MIYLMNFLLNTLFDKDGRNGLSNTLKKNKCKITSNSLRIISNCIFEPN